MHVNPRRLEILQLLMLQIGISVLLRRPVEIVVYLLGIQDLPYIVTPRHGLGLGRNDDVSADIVHVVIERDMLLNRPASDEDVVLYPAIEALTKLDRTAQAQVVVNVVVAGPIVEVDAPAM